MHSHSYNNLFIVLEGIDGVGKTSLGQTLCDTMSSLYGPTCFINSLTKPFAEHKDFVDAHYAADAHYFFYVSAMLQLSSAIQRKLITNHVILDRYVYSTQAYHRARNVSPILNLAELNVLQPDLVFYVHIDDESIRQRRIKKRPNNKRGDEEIRTHTSLLTRVDSELRSLSFIPIDNSSENPHTAVNSMMETLADFDPPLNSLSGPT